MLCRDFMPRTNDATLQERERGLYAVGRNVSVNVDAVLMPDCLMLHSRLTCTIKREGIGRKLIGHNHINVFAHMLFDIPSQRSGLRILGLEEPQLASTLLDADDGDFCFLA